MKTITYGSIPVRNVDNNKEKQHFIGSDSSDELTSTASSRKRIKLVSFLAFSIALGYAAVRVNRQHGKSSEIPLKRLSASLTKPKSLQASNSNNDKRWILPEKNDITKPLLFEQIVDHNHPETSGTYQQRYFQSVDYFLGPGHPIFVIVGGESELTGIQYPFISESLGAQFGAATICPEHRYFGKSWPTAPHPTNADLREQLTVRQALQDAIGFVQAKQEEFGCGPRGSSTYCPIIAAGGSYGAFLATLLRITYPDVVDMTYAGGAPMHLWDNANPEMAANQYYDYITQVADRESPGCASTVRETLQAMLVLGDNVTMDDDDDDDGDDVGRQDLLKLAEEFGICPDTLSEDIQSETELANILVDKVVAKYSDTNMEYYPPRPDKHFMQVCKAFQNASSDDGKDGVKVQIKTFLLMIQKWDRALLNPDEEQQPLNQKCYDMGHRDNSAEDDRAWGVLVCRLLPPMAHSRRSMFPFQAYDLQDDLDICAEQFGMDDASPSDMVDEFHFTEHDLKEHGSRILFTNGDNDGWRALSYLADLNDSVIVMNIEHGAHHSDLLKHWNPMLDTPDIRKAHVDIANLLAKWLAEVQSE